MYKRLVKVIAVVVLAFSHQLKAIELVIVSDIYCPYFCAGPESQGFLVDLSKAIFESQGYRVSYQNLPWLRAVRRIQFDSSEEVAYLSFWNDSEEGWHRSALPASVL